MAEQGVGQFYEALSKDEEIRNQISQIQISSKDNEEVLEMVLPIAKQLGFDLTKEDFAQYAQECVGQVAAVSDWDTCFCAIGGGGHNHTQNYSCACVLGGGGKSDADGCGLWCMIAGTLGYGI